MRIGIDARPLQNNNRFRGTGRYLENVLRSFATLANVHTYVFYLDRGAPIPRDVIELFAHAETRNAATRKASIAKKVKYVRALVRPYKKVKVKNGEVDVFFQADPWLGIPKNVPTVATFLDVIPLLFKLERRVSSLKGIKKGKQMFGEVVRNKFYKEMLDSFRDAAAIVAISNSSKSDYISFIDSSAENKVFVTHLAGSESSFPEITKLTIAEVRRKYGLSDSPFLLYVGGIDQRKNIAGLAKDFFELKKEYSDLKMVMAGKEFALKRDLTTVGWTPLLKEHPEEAKDIRTPGFVPDDELAVLYAEAAVFPFPSLYEGFGLPILEAMHLGCPVVCYDNSSLPEVAGDAALIVKNGESMVSAIKKILDSAQLRQDLIKRGKIQSRKFSWDKTAKKILSVLGKVAV